MIAERRIELCLASAHFFPTHGGAQLRFLRYLPGLRERGIYTRVVAGTPKSKKRLLSMGSEQEPHTSHSDGLLEAELMGDIPVRRVRLPDKAGWRRSIAFNQAIVRFCRQPGYRPHVIQVVSSLQPRSVPWLIYLRRLGLPVIYAYAIPTTMPANPLRRFVRKRALRVLYGHLDCMVVSSDVMRDLALEAGARIPIEVIPNGVNLQRFRAAKDDVERKALRASLGIPENGKMITTVGAVHPRKGSDVLLASWVRLAKRFPEAHLFLIGLRKDLRYPKLLEFRRRLEGLIQASGASDRVHFPGLVRNIEDYLRASDLFVFPSQREGMPNVVLEAMASGLPVILTPFIGLSGDFGEPGREYLLVERDPEALSAAIAEVLEKGEMRAALGEQARRWIENNMDVEKSLDHYAALYRTLADGAQGRRHHLY